MALALPCSPLNGQRLAKGNYESHALGGCIPAGSSTLLLGGPWTADCVAIRPPFKPSPTTGHIAMNWSLAALSKSSRSLDARSC